MGFKQVTSDPCVYTDSKEEKFFIAVYVDDIILAGKTDERMTKVKRSIGEKFKVKDMGELHHFLGVKVVQKKSSGEIWIGQELYTKELVKKFQMDQS